MLTINVLDENGTPYGHTTITLRTPGTFPKIPAGMEKWKIERRLFRARNGSLPTRAELTHIEDLVDYISDWSGFPNNGKPMECNRANVAAYLTGAPWVRRQVEEAIEALKQSGTF